MRAGHETRTVGANAAWHPHPNAIRQAPVSAAGQMLRRGSASVDMMTEV